MDLLVNKQLSQQLEALPERLQDRVAAALNALAAAATDADPRPNARRIATAPDIYEFRYGSLRVPFMVEQTPEGDEVVLAIGARLETAEPAVATA